MSWLRALGYVKRSANQGVTYTELQQIGTAAIATLMDRVFARTKAIGGTPSGGVYGGDLLCTVGSGTREVDVATGTLFYYDSTVTSLYAPSYTPRYVAGTTLTHSANSSGSARYDIIVVTPGTTDGDTTSRRVKSTAAGASTTDSLAGHTAYTGALSITEGTPGAGVPSTPAGTIKIAEVLIANGATAAIVYDKRAIIGNDQGITIPWVDVGGVNYSVPVVHSGLAVTAAGGSMVVSVSAGTLDFQGRRYAVEAASLTLSAADGSNDRYDVIKWDASTGRLSVTEGTPSASISVPITGASIAASTACYLAVVRVEASDTEVVNGDITDIRRVGPYHGGSESLPTLRPHIGAIAADASNLRVVDLFVVDRDGKPYAGQVYVRVKVHDLASGGGAIAASKAGIGDITTGTFVLGEDTASALILTDSNGEASFSVGALTSFDGNYIMDVEVVEYLAALTAASAVDNGSPVLSARYRGGGTLSVGFDLPAP